MRQGSRVNGAPGIRDLMIDLGISPLSFTPRRLYAVSLVTVLTVRTVHLAALELKDAPVYWETCCDVFLAYTVN